MAGYIRVSKVGGRDRRDGYISEQVQEEAIRAWAKRHATKVVIHDAERNVSGGTMNRPVFNAIMQQVKAGERGGIVVFKIDRFARSVYGALSTLAELGEHDAAFASCSEDISYVSAQERAFLQMQFVFAEYVRNSLAESWSVATESAVRRGIHISAHVPFGYDKGEDRRFVPNEFSSLATEVFRMRGDGAGWHRLCSFLDEQAPLSDGRRWGVSRVQRMVANRVYLGEARYGENVNPDAHPPLVTVAEFERAQRARGVSLPRKPDKEPLLLGGILRCSSCRYLLKEGSGGRQGAPRIRTYRCNSRAVMGRCPNPQYIVADRVERYVSELFKDQLRDVVGKAAPSSSELGSAQRELAAAEAELTAFTLDLDGARRLRRLGRYDEAFEARVGAVERAEAEVRRLTRASVGDGLGDLSAWKFDIDEWWETAGASVRKTVLSGGVDVIFVRGPGKAPVEDRVLVMWAGQGPEDLPRRGKTNGPLRGFEW